MFCMIISLLILTFFTWTFQQFRAAVESPDNPQASRHVRGERRWTEFYQSFFRIKFEY